MSKKESNMIERMKFFAVIFLGLLSLSALAKDANGKRYSDRTDVRGFINDLSVDEGFNRAELMALFRDVEHQAQVIKAYSKPAERALSWKKYRKIFVKPGRIEKGVEFWQQNADVLERAEQATGVPAEMIVAIIGVETRFGTYKGRNKVLDSLTTLAFEREKRQAFFRRELKEFLLLCREQGFDPREVKGSYAGAMGMPQFIASSYRAYAIDFDDDKKIDLFNNVNDVIGSVANYFKRHGWKSGETVVTNAITQSDLSDHAVGRGRKGLKPEHNAAHYAKLGAKPSKTIADDESLVLMYFDDEQDGIYKFGHHNFYVISRYNHSSMYSLAAYQLSQQIKAAYEQVQQKKAAPVISAKEG